MSTSAYVMQCQACGHPRGGGRYFCSSCGVLLSDPTQSAHAASRWTRFGGWVLDYAILNLTFGIGWIIWHIFTSRRGQSPGKALLRMRVHRVDGTQAGMMLMWLRDFWWDVGVGIIAALVVTLFFVDANAESGIPFLVLVIVGLIAPAVDAAVLLVDVDRQTLRDKVFNTLVVEVRPVQAPVHPPPGTFPPDR